MRDPFDGIVEQTDQRGSFRVRSRTRNRWHMVDLLEGEAGMCSCEAFAFKAGKKRKKRSPQDLGPLDSYCYHIRTVLAWLGWQVMWRHRRTNLPHVKVGDTPFRRVV